ncbi:hypothetical protein BGY98DRAFT_145746 [Russula aff. rugulosa BPL654]|nr:hypothetical protein BGY98DRAFT_145746 [Russula aff. rugulosa BPL654]
MFGSEWSLESDARGPDPYDMKSDDEDEEDDNGGHDGDNDDPSDNDHSAYGSTGYMSQSPEPEHPASPEPMTDVEKLLGSLRPRPRNSGSAAVGTSKESCREPLTLRRTFLTLSLSLQTTQVANILTLSSMVRARTTSVSSVIGGGAVTFVHAFPKEMES